jgi:hypothetical protein
LLTTLENLGEGTGGGGVVAEEIELGRPSLGGGGVARSGGEEKGSGVPGPRANGADFGRRRGGTEDSFTGGGERRMAGDGAAAGFPGGGACGDEGKVREVWMSVKEQPQVLVLHLYRTRREERGSRLDVLAINGHGGLRPSMPSRGGS